MDAGSAAQLLRRRIVPEGAVPLLVAVLVVASFMLIACWWGPRVEAWQAARGFVDAVRDGDCENAAKFSTITPPAAGCSTRAYGLPADLRGYSVSTDWFGFDRDAGPATAVGLKVPGYRDDYSLSVSRLGDKWVVTDVIVFV